MWTALFLIAGQLAPAPEHSTSEAERLVLEDALAIADRQAVDIVRARDDLLLADVERARSLSTVLPSLNFSTSANELFYGNYITEARAYRPNADQVREDGSPVLQDYGPFSDIQGTYSQPNFNLSLALRQVIYDGGRWWALIGRANDIESSRRANLEAIAANLRLLVVRRFYEMAKATRGVDTFSLQVRLAEDQLARSISGIKDGRSKQNEVALGERNLASDRVTLARRVFLESTRARALNLALGREPGILFQLVIPRAVETTTRALRPISVPDTDLLLEEATVSRPEIRASLGNLDVLRRNVTIRFSDYLPTIGVNATYLKSSRRPDRVFGDPTLNTIGVLGIDLRWNLFQGLGTNASVEEGEIEVHKATASHLELVRNVRGEVLEKLEQLQLLIRVFALNQDAMRAAEEATRIVSSLYRENRATLLELRDAEFRLITARDAIYDVRFDIEIAIEELRRAIGRDPEAIIGKRVRVIE